MKNLCFSPAKSLVKLTMILLLLISNKSIVSAQSINGNVSSFSSSNLAYGNVNIYQGDELVASVLTDAFGNFNVKLDSGEYRCEILYAGFEKIVQDLKVSSDMNMDFSMKEEKDSKFKPRKASAPAMDMGEVYLTEDMPIEASGEMMHRSAEVSKVRHKTYTRNRSTTMIYIPESERSSAVAMVLTAGEINDFKKWDEWKGIVSDDLTHFIPVWGFNPRGRYTVEVKNEFNFPIVGASVKLIGESGKIIHQARTDNTGKAELWQDILISGTNENVKNILVEHQGTEKTVRNPLLFEEGINHVEIAGKCGASNLVEIAFVVDATGSMGDEIEFLKEELNEIIYKSKENHPALEFRFGNVFYRDHGDAYLTKTQNFTNVLSEAVYFISEQSAYGGGDYEEAVEIALDTAINELSWSEEARTKLVFLILDAPPHQEESIKKSLHLSMQTAAKQGIKIIPIVASGSDKSNEYLMRALALATNGTYTFITGHSGVSSGHVEPTTKDYNVELLHDILVRIIKNNVFYPNCQEEMALEEEDKNIEMEVWPNPATELVNVKINEDIDCIYLLDLSGKILARSYSKENERSFSFQVNQFAKGIYFIGYEKDKIWKTEKLVIS